MCVCVRVCVCVWVWVRTHLFEKVHRWKMFKREWPREMLEVNMLRWVPWERVCVRVRVCVWCGVRAHAWFWRVRFAVYGLWKRGEWKRERDLNDGQQVCWTLVSKNCLLEVVSGFFRLQTFLEGWKWQNLVNWALYYKTIFSVTNSVTILFYRALDSTVSSLEFFYGYIHYWW